MKPHPNNFCGGAFPDWLEVNLLKQCNAQCVWCVEKSGYHPKQTASWRQIADKALKHGSKNIILLGGEPTLYPDLQKIISYLTKHDKNVYITTNGSLLTHKFVSTKLNGLHGINISIHHCDMYENYEITGVSLKYSVLLKAIKCLQNNGVNIRLNCNIIDGYIDSQKSIDEYLDFAKLLGVDSVRFAELKQDTSFVSLAKIFNYQYGLTDNPFVNGCNINTTRKGVNVCFRQMCGLQTDERVKPANPELAQKYVLYYDGNIYNGWQINSEVKIMRKIEIAELLKKVKKGELSEEEASRIIYESVRTETRPTEGSGCVY